MAKDESTESQEPQDQTQDPLSNVEEEMDSDSDSESDESSDSDGYYVSESEKEEDDDEDASILNYTRPSDIPPDPNVDPETNIRRFTRLLDGKRVQRIYEEDDEDYTFHEDLFDFPKDPERWKEEDLRELWVDGPLKMTKPGWDPACADEEDWKIVEEEIEDGKDPGIEPFYVPYRKPYPVIPDNHYDIQNAKAVIEELDRIEEFLQWVSYIFPDGSSYEGTVWDDLAHGKGVYIAEDGLVRYEGEWLQNDMEGHGVIEVDIPDIEPIPGSKLEAKMRKQGRILKMDYMTPEDRKWLEMDIEDSIALTDGNYQVPFYENEEWVRQFGQKPEKGRYRYAGQWKHGRMHGCGVYEVNGRLVYGRFYFGELLEEEHDCNSDACALHSGIAEIAAGKARMFVNKPDGMVREDRGPYCDPQHPYFYEEEDVWMAPGFINQFYEVPDYWKTYVDEVDQEREMWLNSFYRSPLRIAMPAELEYWWQNAELTPEFVLLNKEPEPDPEDPSKLVYKEDPLILHTPTGRIIDYVDDEEHGIRLFWHPPPDDETAKPEFLPLGFDEFYGKVVEEKIEHPITRFFLGIEKTVKAYLEKWEKWTEEKREKSVKKMEMIKDELELVEAEIQLEEAMEELDEELKRREKEEEKKTEMGLADDDYDDDGEKENVSASVYQEEKGRGAVIAKEEVSVDDEDDDVDGDDDDDDDFDDDAPSSFGSVDNRTGKSPFSSSSLSFSSCTLFPVVKSRLEKSFLAWKLNRSSSTQKPNSEIVADTSTASNAMNSIKFPLIPKDITKLKAGNASSSRYYQRFNGNTRSQSQMLKSLSRILLSGNEDRKSSCCDRENLRFSGKEEQLLLWEGDIDGVLSMHVPLSPSVSGRGFS